MTTPEGSQPDPSWRGRGGQWDPEEVADSPSLAPLVRLLWSYRRVIAAVVSVVLILAVLAGLVNYVLQPVERQASIEFRLLFEGADRQEYPNGLPFSRAEIISTPVLTAVFESNDLDRYCTYDEFKTSVYVLESSEDLDLLSLEYQARLAETRLSAVDRNRIEEEFRQRREALRVPQYSLNFMSPGGRAKIPDAVMSKVLGDILTTWAEHAAETKGVLNYQVGLLTPAAVSSEVVASDDLLVRVDILRGKILHILRDLDTLAELPGAATIRVGEGRVSLAEVRVTLEDALRFRLEPLADLVASTGLSSDPAGMTRYFESRLRQVTLDRDLAAGTVATLRDSLGNYLMERGASGAQLAEGGRALSGQPGASTVIPQVSESFLDRLVTLSEQSQDVKYRQALTDRMIEAGERAVTLERALSYYENVIAAVRRGTGGGRGRAPAETLAHADAAFEEVLKTVNSCVQQANMLYEAVSAHNLNPRTQLLTMTSPFSVRTLRAFSLRSIATYVAIAFLFSIFVVPLGCLVHHYLKTEGPLSDRPTTVVRAPAGERGEVGRPGAAPAGDRNPV